MGYSPWGLKESDTTERLHFHGILECIFKVSLMYILQTDFAFFFPPCAI